VEHSGDFFLFLMEATQFFFVAVEKEKSTAVEKQVLETGLAN
jgi:hypothetical protein